MWGYGGVKIRMPLWRLIVTLQTTMCLCRIKADCVRPVHLLGTNRYWPKLPENANQLVHSTTSCWETWLSLQQDWAPPHWHLAVRTFLNEHLPNRRIGRTGQNDQVFRKWPPRSPNLTVCDFFLWGYVKGRVYVPPLPATMDELQECITAAVNSVTPDMLQRVWSELDYCIDVCRVTRGGHTECVWYHMKLYEFVQL